MGSLEAEPGPGNKLCLVIATLQLTAAIQGNRHNDIRHKSVRIIAGHYSARLPANHAPRGVTLPYFSIRIARDIRGE